MGCLEEALVLRGEMPLPLVGNGLGKHTEDGLVRFGPHVVARAVHHWLSLVAA